MKLLPLTQEELSDSFMFELSEQLDAMLKRRKITPADFARKLKVNRAYVAKLLNGSENLTIESLVKIAMALDCRLTIGLDEHPPEVRRASRRRAARTTPNSSPA